MIDDNHKNKPENYDRKIKIAHHIKNIDRINKFLYEKPLFKVPLFLLSFLILFVVTSMVFHGNDHILKWIYLSLYILATVYILFFVIHLIAKSLKALLNANNIFALVISYGVFMFCLLLFFTSLYSATTSLEKGYLTYGTCSDKFDKSMIHDDPLRSNDHFYFSAVTLFTVGYGDICPMGWDKTIAIINAFTGVSVNVIIMVLVVSSFIDRKKIN